VCHILSTFLTDRIFFVIPRSDLGSLVPRDLPREIFVDEATVLPTDLNAPKKRGRPTRRDKAKKARVALDSLDKWLDKAPPILPITSGHGSRTSTTNTLEQYQVQKSLMLNAVYTSPDTSDERSAVERANRFVLDRLKAAEELVSADVFATSTEGNLNAGLTRVERAVGAFDAHADRRGGILSLLEGAGISQISR
jgi:hypothetical protein